MKKFGLLAFVMCAVSLPCTMTLSAPSTQTAREKKLSECVSRLVMQGQVRTPMLKGWTRVLLGRPVVPPKSALGFDGAEFVRYEQESGSIFRVLMECAPRKDVAAFIHALRDSAISEGLSGKDLDVERNAHAFKVTIPSEGTPGVVIAIGAKLIGGRMVVFAGKWSELTDASVSRAYLLMMRKVQ